LKAEEVGAVGRDKVVWLAAGRHDGSVCTWDLETERCVTTLHPMVDVPHDYSSKGVSVAPHWSHVVHFADPDLGDLGKGGLHVWDLSSDGIQERYAFAHGCKNRFGFEIASAALLYQNNSKRSGV
jgi:WD40 repeat protein